MKTQRHCPEKKTGRSLPAPDSGSVELPAAVSAGAGETVRRVAARLLLFAAILGIGATASGCLWVRDDQGHHHWRWHHDADHDDHDHHDDDH
jgi:hypothetical protein